MSKYRDVSWILQKFRTALLGREWNKSQLRKKANMSSRSPPQPILNDNPRISDFAYYKRDTRRLVTPPKDIVLAKGEGKKIEAKVGQSLMLAALAAGIEIEGACEGNCACSTCHVYIDEEHYAKLEPASEEEEDMLDQALFVKPTSRLSCQIVMEPRLDGLEFKRPHATRNFYAGKQQLDT